MSEAALDAAKAVDGWMADDELAWLARTAQGCRTIVEVGSYKGRSTRALADNTDGVVYAVDPWAGASKVEGGAASFDHDVWEDFRDNLRPHLESGRVVPVRLPFHEAFGRELRHLLGGVDLVFIDGDHRLLPVLGDIALGQALVRPRGMLAGHDYGYPDWPDVKRAVDLVFPQRGLCRSIWWVVR